MFHLGPMAQAQDPALTRLLKEDSRSFYLTLRILPGAVRHQIGLAYLLARTSDTIADTELVPAADRLKALEQFRQALNQPGPSTVDFGELVRKQGNDAERTLLNQCSRSVALFHALAAADRSLVQTVLNTIIGGQELDLRRFQGASAERMVALRTDAELDDYTYRVAGCVGEFWTRICLAHLFFNQMREAAELINDGIRFGKGLQLVNILRDIPADLRQGRCYLPEEKLAGAGLAPHDLVDTGTEARLRPLYNAYLDSAEAHLRAGWSYTIRFPRGYARLQLACAWPILIGLETIDRLRVGHVLDGSHRIKVPRARIRRIIVRSVLLYPWRNAWEKMAAV